MTDTKGSSIGFLILVGLVAFLGWRLSSPPQDATQTVESPNSCAAYLLAQAGYGPASALTETPIPNELKDKITSQCILPYLSPANGQTPPLVTP